MHDMGTMSALERVAPYAKGDIVDVYYDPNDPARAVLERGWEGRTLWSMLGAGLLAYFFAFAEIAGLRRTAARGEHKRGLRGRRSRSRRTKRKRR